MLFEGLLILINMACTGNARVSSGLDLQFSGPREGDRRRSHLSRSVFVLGRRSAHPAMFIHSTRVEA